MQHCNNITNSTLQLMMFTLLNSTRIFAAGLSTPHDLKMVAPSLVTWTEGSPLPYLPRGAYRILSMPRGPSVLFTKSPIAMAPTNELRRAVSALSFFVKIFFQTRKIVPFPPRHRRGALGLGSLPLPFLRVWFFFSKFVYDF